MSEQKQPYTIKEKDVPGDIARLQEMAIELINKKDKDIAKHTTTVYLLVGDIARLQAIAAQLGYFYTRGPGTGTVGSPSAMWRAQAAGEVVMVSKEDFAYLEAYRQEYDRS